MGTALLLLLSWYLAQGGFERIGWLFQIKTLGPRLSNWRSAYLLWKTYPLIGVGPEMFSEYVPQIRPIGGAQSQYVHNLYLETLAETGLCGFVALLVFQIGVLRLFVRRFRELPRTEWFLPAAGLAAVTVYTLHACIDFTHIQPEILFLAAFYLGISANRFIGKGAATMGPSGTSRGMYLPAAIFAAGLLASIARWRGAEPARTRPLVHVPARRG